MEIERKFLVKELPKDLSKYECIEIKQGYLSRIPVVRIRKWNDKYILTYKRKLYSEDEGIAIQNEEVELPLDEPSFLHLSTKVDNNIINKKRYIIPIHDGLKVELDIFEGKLDGLIVAEVEFPDSNTAANFVKPDWLGADVSFDKRYRNAFLSMLKSMDDFGGIK